MNANITRTALTSVTFACEPDGTFRHKAVASLSGEALERRLLAALRAATGVLQAGDGGRLTIAFAVETPPLALDTDVNQEQEEHP